MTKKTIALIQGDPGGIGPELMVKLLKEPDILEAARVVIIGAPEVFARGEDQVGERLENVRHVAPNAPIDVAEGEILHMDLPVEGIGDVPVAETSAEGGKSSIEGLRLAFDLFEYGKIDGAVFMPFNKSSMHLGGNAFSDELGFARDYFDLKTPASEFNVANGMWNGRITSHVAMRDVPNLLTIDGIVEGIQLADRTLKLAGYTRPRIVVAAYNPHAGDGGLMGDEEIRIIGPAVEKAQQTQVQCVGPLPADTLWLKVRDGEYDAVITMYHDQGQIAIKLLGFDKGVSVLAGLPLPVTTPAHGTAFDIAGQSKANLDPTKNAFIMCTNMANNRMATEGVAAA
ncbi:MAG: 4-hydroxythreonine-4-phosphate dehydrogenase PdxA [Pseudomonadota bacterium]